MNDLISMLLTDTIRYQSDLSTDQSPISDLLKSLRKKFRFLYFEVELKV